MSTEEQSIENKGIQSISEFIDTNKNNILIAGIALIVLVAGLYYYQNVYKLGVEAEANESIFTAERYFAQDSLNLALNGDGLHPGMREVADDYGSTAAGNRAAFYTGRILLEQGKYEEALEYLEDASMSDELMAAQVITLQGDCYSELDQFEKAGDMYITAAKKRDNTLTTPYALLKAGTAYEEAGELSDAKSAYKKLQADYADSKWADKVEARIARVAAKQAAQ